MSTSSTGGSADVPEESPVDVPGEAPVHLPEEGPAEMSEECPVKVFEEAPAEVPGNGSDLAKASPTGGSADVPGESPVDVPGEAPVHLPEEGPAEMPGDGSDIAKGGGKDPEAHEVSPKFVYDEESKTLSVRHVNTLQVANVDTVHVGDIHHHFSDVPSGYKEMEMNAIFGPIDEPVTTGKDVAGAIEADPRIRERLDQVISNYHNPRKWVNNHKLCLELVSLFMHQGQAVLTKVRFKSVHFFVRVKLGPDHDAFLQACRDGTLSRGLTKLLVTPELEEAAGPAAKIGVRLDVEVTSNTNRLWNLNGIMSAVGLGALIGSVAGPIGAAVGAGVGAGIGATAAFLINDKFKK